MNASQHVRIRRAGLACIAILAVAACAVEVGVTTPEEITDPGFSGDWIAPVLGSDMILRIGEFRGLSAPTGRILWRDIDWGLACRLDRSFEPVRLTCNVLPDVAGATCSVPDENEPFVEISEAVPNTRIEATVGGELRPGGGNPCDAPPIVSWDGPVITTFVPG